MISLTEKIANNTKYNTPNVVYRGTDKLTDTYLVQIQGIALTPLGARIAVNYVILVIWAHIIVVSIHNCSLRRTCSD